MRNVSAILVKAAQRAGNILLSHRTHTTLEYSHKKSHQDIVTQADIQSQQCIKDTVIAEMIAVGVSKSDIGFIGEEALHMSGEHLFVIDPLDGTSNYATGTDDFCVLIAYCYNNKLRAGITYFPKSNEYYLCEKGNGVTKLTNRQQITIGTIQKPLEETFLYSSLTYSDDVKMGIDTFLKPLKTLFRGVCMIGCAGKELSLLVDGVAGAVVLGACSIWDIAPGKCMLSELGYELYTVDGAPVELCLDLPLKKYPFIACHKSNISHILHTIENSRISY